MLVESSFFYKVIHPTEGGGSILFNSNGCMVLTKTCSSFSKCGQNEWGIFCRAQTSANDKMKFYESTFSLSGQSFVDRAILKSNSGNQQVKSLNISFTKCDHEPSMYMSSINSFFCSHSNFVNGTGRQWEIVLSGVDCKVKYCNFASNRVEMWFFYSESVSSEFEIDSTNVVNNVCPKDFFQTYFQSPGSTITVKDCFFNGNSPLTGNVTMLSTAKVSYDLPENRFLSTFDCSADMPLSNAKQKLFYEVMSCHVDRSILYSKSIYYIMILLDDC